tara:strand:+ start:14361 stop:14741 length:381 start_codon:yes stop_codon:yes gene_type:complete
MIAGIEYLVRRNNKRVIDVTIKDILEKLVKDYQESEYKNYGRDMSYLSARKELLTGGKLYTFEVGSSTVKPVRMKGSLEYTANPIVADACGEFPEVVGEGLHRVMVNAGALNNTLLISDGVEAYKS